MGFERLLKQLFVFESCFGDKPKWCLDRCKTLFVMKVVTPSHFFKYLVIHPHRIHLSWTSSTRLERVQCTRNFTKESLIYIYLLAVMWSKAFYLPTYPWPSDITDLSRVTKVLGFGYEVLSPILHCNGTLFLTHGMLRPWASHTVVYSFLNPSHFLWTMYGTPMGPSEFPSRLDLIFISSGIPVSFWNTRRLFWSMYSLG